MRCDRPEPLFSSTEVDGSNSISSGNLASRIEPDRVHDARARNISSSPMENSGNRETMDACRDRTGVPEPKGERDVVEPVANRRTVSLGGNPYVNAVSATTGVGTHRSHSLLDNYFARVGPCCRSPAKLDEVCFQRPPGP
jgi:hypothetical protein